MKNKNDVHRKGVCRHLILKMLCLFILISAAPFAFAQSVTVKGTVKDAQGSPLPGVAVKVQGTTQGTLTDVDGNYSVAVPSSKSTLVFSFIGMETQSMVVGSQRMLSITMKDSSIALNEVVAIGYGSIKKSSLTGAVSQMKTEGIADRPLARAEAALQGAMPGVDVRTTTGEPGQNMQIRVRGAASVNASSDPLYVIDGAPASTLVGLNPSDISSIEVLKDAASTAIYGSRGSNGVIIVTTKKGKSGKPVISLNANYGIQTLEKKMDLLSATEWIQFRLKYNDANYLAQAKSKGITTASIKDDNATRMANIGGNMTSPNYTVVNDDRWFNYLSDAVKSAHTYTPSTDQLSLLDWQDKFFRNAPTQEYTLNITGGSDNTKYMFSGGYFKQQGIATGTDYRRISLRANLESKINKWVTAGIILAPTYSSSNGAGLANGKDAKTHQTLSSTPVSAPGVGYYTNVQPNTIYLWAGSTSSTWYIMNTNLAHDNSMRMQGTTFLRVEPFKGMKIEATGSTNFTSADGETYNYSSAGGTWASGEGVNSSGGHTTTSRFDNTLFQVVANYDNSFGKHNVSAMAGFSTEQNSWGYTTNQTFSKPFANDAITQSFDGSLVAVGKDIVTQLTPTTLVSMFGRFQYDYDGKYFISTSVRRDGGSVFGVNNKWGTFPALSGGWKISDEPFFKNLKLDAINMLKLRASYGSTGNNAISTTAAYALLTATTYAGQSGYNISSSANPNLGWEKANSTDVAMDIAMLRNRIQLSLDYYTKLTSNLLYQVPVLAATGLTKQWGNLGDIKNKGFEVELNTKNLTGKFQWSSTFNFSYNTNTVTRLGTTNTPVYSGFDDTNVSNVLMVGKPMNTFYMYEAVGVWKTQAEIDAYSTAHGGKTVTFNGTTIKPGDIRYNDVNNDGVFTTADKAYLGSPTPKCTYGFINNFSYKNFDLSIVTTAQSGGKIYGILGRAIDRPSMGALSNVMGRWRNAWWSETEQGDGKTPYILSTTTGTTLDSRWLYSSDYIRIKNLTLGYSITSLKKIFASCRIYASIENLALFSKYYGGYSPEAANSGSSSAPGGSSALGIDYGGYPIARVYTMGINITF